MHLYLSDTFVLNAVFSNESGQALYKVTTTKPCYTTGRVSSISRILPSSIPGSPDTDPLKDRWGHLATVEHHTIRSSIITMGGEEHKTSEYFKKSGTGSSGLWNRAFTGPDGKEYKWCLEMTTSELLADDGTLVAKFHMKSLGIIGQAHPASLEIFSAGEHMMDLIIVTFIFIEKMRSDGPYYSGYGVW